MNQDNRGEETSPAYDFFTAPEEVRRPAYERAAKAAQKEQEAVLTPTETDIEAIENLQSYEYWQDNHGMPYPKAVEMVAVVRLYTQQALHQQHTEHAKEMQLLKDELYDLNKGRAST